MVEIVAAETAAKAGWALLKPFAGFLAAASVGFAAAEAMEHKAPWGLGPHLAAKTKQAARAAADAAAWRDLVLNPNTGWKAAYARLQAARTAEAAQAAREVNAASAASGKACAAAFDQGYSAGRALARNPGANDHGKNPADPRGGAGAVSGGVRAQSGDDFADQFGRGAYRP